MKEKLLRKRRRSKQEMKKGDKKGSREE